MERYSSKVSTASHHAIPRVRVPLHTTPQHTTPHHHTKPNHTTPHHATPRHAHTTPHHTTPHYTTPHYTAPHHTKPHHTAPHHTIPNYALSRSPPRPAQPIHYACFFLHFMPSHAVTRHATLCPSDLVASPPPKSLHPDLVASPPRSHFIPISLPRPSQVTSSRSRCLTPPKSLHPDLVASPPRSHFIPISLPHPSQVISSRSRCLTPPQVTSSRSRCLTPPKSLHPDLVASPPRSHFIPISDCPACAFPHSFVSFSHPTLAFPIPSRCKQPSALVPRRLWPTVHSLA